MPRPPDSTISASVSSGSPVETSSRRSTNFICAAGVGPGGRTVLRKPYLRRATLGELRPASLARLDGEQHGIGPATRDARGLADDLGHHLLRRPPPVILDDAPERVRHGPRPSDRLGFFA